MPKERGVPQGLDEDLSRIYTFLGNLYPANWQVRFGDTPYMEGMISAGDMKDIVGSKGYFESIAGHKWMMAVEADLLLDHCPGLAGCLDSRQVFKAILYHDVRELKNGDVSMVKQIQTGVHAGLEQEKIDLRELLSTLPDGVACQIGEMCDLYEQDGSQEQSLEILFVRLLDALQAHHCVLVLGNDLGKHSDLIERISKKRAGPRARSLVDRLRGRDDTAGKQAAFEIEKLLKFHLEQMREQGVNINLSEFGF